MRDPSEPNICPECALPACAEVGAIQHAMAVSPRYDDQGRRHIHSPNGPSYWTLCANGHQWHGPQCWCGWGASHPKENTQ